MTGSNQTRWGEVVIAWPFERVTLDLEVVTTRDLTTLEWVLERILDEFSEDPPTLAEAAAELGLAEPRFLLDTLRQLLDLQAVERTAKVAEDNTGKLDLAQLQLTPMGRELFRQGKIEGAPEHPRLELFFDVMTGEHQAKLPKPQPDAAGRLRLLSEDEWPAPKSTLSLDHLRTYSKERGERYHRGETRIRAASIQEDDSPFFVCDLPILLSLDAEGAVQISGPLSAKQRTWLQENAQRLVAHASLPGALAPASDPPVATAAWLGQDRRLISVRELGQVIMGLLDRAKHEVVLHGCWRDLLDLGGALQRQSARGVHCVVRSQEPTTLDHWEDRGEQPPGFVLGSQSAELAELPVALVIDGSEAIFAESITVRLPGAGSVRVVVAVRVHGARAEAAHAALRRGVADEIAQWASDEGDRSLSLTALFLGASVAHVPQLIAIISLDLPPLEIAAQLKRLGTWLRERPGVSSVDWAVWARRALEEHLDQLVDLSAEDLPALAALSVGILPPERVLERLLQLVQPVSALIDASPLELLQRILPHLKAQPGGADLANTPLVRRFTDQCLNLPPQPQLASPSLIERIRQLVGEERAQRWAARYSGQWAQPTEVSGLQTWLQAHAPVRRLISDFGRLATSFLQRTLATATEPLDEATQLALRAAWTACSLPESELNGLLRKQQGREPRRETGDGDRTSRKQNKQVKKAKPNARKEGKR